MLRTGLIAAGLAAGALAWLAAALFGRPQEGEAPPYPSPTAEAVAGRLSDGAAALADFGALTAERGLVLDGPRGTAMDRPAAGYWWPDGAAALAVAVTDEAAFLDWAASLSGGAAGEMVRVDGVLARRTGDLLAAIHGERGWVATDFEALRHAMRLPMPAAADTVGIRVTLEAGASAMRVSAERGEGAWTIRVARPVLESEAASGLPAGLYFPEDRVHGAMAMSLDGGRKAAVLAVLRDLAGQTGDAATLAAAEDFASILTDEFSAAAFTGEDGRWGYAVAIGVTDVEGAAAWVRERFAMESPEADGPTAYLGTPLWVNVEDGRLWAASDKAFLAAWRERAMQHDGDAFPPVTGTMEQGFADGAALPYLAAPLRHGSGHWSWLGRALSGLDRISWRGERSDGEERIELEALLRPTEADGQNP